MAAEVKSTMCLFCLHIPFLNAIYYKYYQVQLVFISKDGQWVKGPLLSERPQNKEVLHLTWAQTPEETGEFFRKTNQSFGNL